VTSLPRTYGKDELLSVSYGKKKNREVDNIDNNPWKNKKSEHLQIEMLHINLLNNIDFLSDLLVGC